MNGEHSGSRGLVVSRAGERRGGWGWGGVEVGGRGTGRAALKGKLRNAPYRSAALGPPISAVRGAGRRALRQRFGTKPLATHGLIQVRSTEDALGRRPVTDSFSFLKEAAAGGWIFDRPPVQPHLGKVSKSASVLCSLFGAVSRTTSAG